MSSTSKTQMTEEQEKFLASLEEEFKDRYTENDEDFKAVLNERLPLPPVVENWREFWQRDDRRDDYRIGRSGHHNEFDRERQRDYRRREPYYRDNNDRYSHSSRYNDRYSQQNHYGNLYRP